jgi:hypothetical protein
MRITKERVHFISKTLLERLLEQNLITVQIPKEELVRRIEHIMTEDLMIEDRLHQEVREILKGYEAEIEKGNVDYHKMFLMVKNKLVKERGIIL